MLWIGDLDFVFVECFGDLLVEFVLYVLVC